MEKTVQAKRKKYLVVVPVIVAGIIAGSMMMDHKADNNSTAKTIEENQTPLAGPTQEDLGDGSAPVASLFVQPVIETADGTMVTANNPEAPASNGNVIDNSAAIERAQQILQLEANLEEAETNYTTAQNQLTEAQNALADAEEAKTATAEKLAKAQKAVEEAQAEVDKYAELKKAYEIAAKLTEAVNYAVNSKGNFAENDDEALAKLYEYFVGRNSNTTSLNSTGANYAPSITAYIDKLLGEGVELDDYYYRVYCKDGVVNVFISDEAAKIADISNFDSKNPQKIDGVYKFYGNGEKGIEAGTLYQGTAYQGEDGSGTATNPKHGKLTDLKENVAKVETTYQDILDADKALEDAKAAEAEAQKNDEAARVEVEKATQNVTEKEQAANDAKADVDTAQAELDAANAQ
ncbi:MAG: hypothetical protein Q4C25_00610 [Bacillota bacterium]|nr:hypothetical protein [Bacillota bacterium]